MAALDIFYFRLISLAISTDKFKVHCLKKTAHSKLEYLLGFIPTFPFLILVAPAMRRKIFSVRGGMRHVPIRGEWGELGRGRSETTSVSDQPIGETHLFRMFQHGSSVGTSPLNGSLFRSPAAEISRCG